MRDEIDALSAIKPNAFLALLEPVLVPLVHGEEET